MLSAILFSACFGVLNRARGSKLFEQTDSTTIGRLASAIVMGYLAMLASGLTGQRAYWLLAWTSISIYLGMLPGWGKYVGAAIGANYDHEEKEMGLVDWIMERLPLEHGRIWGAVAMSVRMILLVPCVIGVAFITGGNPLWGLLAPLMGWCYWITGYLFSEGAWGKGEVLSGALLGLLIFLAI
jgi:hypothetical protein